MAADSITARPTFTMMSASWWAPGPPDRLALDRLAPGAWPLAAGPWRLALALLGHPWRLTPWLPGLRAVPVHPEPLF